MEIEGSSPWSQKPNCNLSQMNPNCNPFYSLLISILNKPPIQVVRYRQDFLVKIFWVFIFCYIHVTYVTCLVLITPAVFDEWTYDTPHYEVFPIFCHLFFLKSTYSQNCLVLFGDVTSYVTGWMS